MIRDLIGRMIRPLLMRVERWAIMNVRREHVVHGFRVTLDNARPDIDSEKVLQRFTDALDLVARYLPREFARIQRDVSQFWIARRPVRGTYFPQYRMIMIELTFLARTDIGPEVVASTIVHEGIHARVDRMRLKPESRSYGREERICRKAQVAFGRALPTELGAGIIREMEAMMAANTDQDFDIKVDWDLANKRQREVDRAAMKRWLRDKFRKKDSK